MPDTTTDEVKSPSKAEAAKAKEHANRNLSGLKKIAHLQRTSTMEIGWIAREMKEKSEFAVLGMEENECRETIGIERATWFRSIQIAEGLKNVGKKRFLTLFAGKAYQLLRLSEKDRYKDVWLDRAADPKLTEAALTEMIDHKLEVGELKADATSVEERGWFKIRMYKKDLDMVNEKLTDFCKEHGLGDDYGQALVVLVTDNVDEKMPATEIAMLREVKKALQNRMPELKATVELLKDAKRPAEDRCATFEKTALVFINDLAKAAMLNTKSKATGAS